MLMRAVLIMCLPQTGKLQLYDLASGNLLETIDAHDGALWSLSLSPDRSAASQTTTPFIRLGRTRRECLGEKSLHMGEKVLEGSKYKEELSQNLIN